MSSWPLGTVPIVIGVTGHRDLMAKDLPALRGAILGVLERFTRDYPNSPRVLLTGLAEGADLLAAHCVLDFNDTCAPSRTWVMHAVLAAPADEFEEDFDTVEGKADFRSTLGRCDAIHVVCASGTADPQRYEQVAHWMARHAHWLVALWDGQHIDRRAGTNWVVRRFRQGSASAEDLLPPDAYPVEQICTRRRSSPDSLPAANVGESRIWGAIAALTPTEDLCDSVCAASLDSFGKPSSEVPLRWALMWRRMDEFNRLARAWSSTDAAQAAVRDLLTRKSTEPGGTLESVPLSAQAAAWMHCVADQLALDAQARTARVFHAMLSCSLLGVAFEQTYSSGVCGGSRCDLLLLAALLFMMLALAPVALRRWLRWEGNLYRDRETRTLDCRALAEASRVQTWWKRAGVLSCAADVHLRGQRDELEWIRQAIRSTELFDQPTAAEQPEAALRFALKQWIADQLAYYEKAASMNQRRQARHARIARGLVGLAVVLLGLLLISKVSAWGPSFSTIETGLLQWAFGMSLAGAAAVKVYQHVKGFQDQYRSYQRMATVMKSAKARVSEALESLERGDLDDATRAQIIEQARKAMELAGRAALEENAAWTLMHRDRNAEPAL